MNTSTGSIFFTVIFVDLKITCQNRVAINGPVKNSVKYEMGLDRTLTEFKFLKINELEKFYHRLPGTQNIDYVNII